jgi:serine/threonine-protein kinase
MSPEQAAGERTIDGRSDLYSLGVLGYQMLTGEPPFVANSTPAILVKHISERPIPVEQRRSDVPQDLSRTIMMMLEKDPANRFPSAAAVVAALDTGRVPQIERAPTPVPPESAPMMLARPSNAYSSSSYPSSRTEDTYGMTVPSFDEIRRLESRWEAQPVKAFRKKLAPYLFVNGVIVIASIVGDSDFFGITVLWSIYLAFKYAKLWADGYDWRDVFRQPRDRDLIDVADDTLTYVRAVMDRDQRKAMREQRRARLGRTGSSPALPGIPSYPSGAMGLSSVYAERVRAAESDRNEILMRLSRMSSSERSRVPDVERSAVALADKVRGLALVLSDIERESSAHGADQLEAEISRLESAANPLDESGSDERVRRLAHLKRQRRAIADVTSRRESVAAKLDTCIVALQNIKLDLIRLNAGSQTPQHVTSLAMDALNLADSVDSALFVSDESGRSTGTRPASRPAAR